MTELRFDDFEKRCPVCFELCDCLNVSCGSHSICQSCFFMWAKETASAEIPFSDVFGLKCPAFQCEGAISLGIFMLKTNIYFYTGKHFDREYEWKNLKKCSNQIILATTKFKKKSKTRILLFCSVWDGKSLGK